MIPFIVIIFWHTLAHLFHSNSDVLVPIQPPSSVNKPFIINHRTVFVVSGQANLGERPCAQGRVPFNLRIHLGERPCAQGTASFNLRIDLDEPMHTYLAESIN